MKALGSVVRDRNLLDSDSRRRSHPFPSRFRTTWRCKLNSFGYRKQILLLAKIMSWQTDIGICLLTTLLFDKILELPKAYSWTKGCRDWLSHWPAIYHMLLLCAASGMVHLQANQGSITALDLSHSRPFAFHCLAVGVPLPCCRRLIPVNQSRLIAKLSGVASAVQP